MSYQKQQHKQYKKQYQQLIQDSLSRPPQDLQPLADDGTVTCTGGITGMMECEFGQACQNMHMAPITQHRIDGDTASRGVAIIVIGSVPWVSAKVITTFVIPVTFFVLITICRSYDIRQGDGASAGTSVGNMYCYNTVNMSSMTDTKFGILHDLHAMHPIIIMNMFRELFDDDCDMGATVAWHLFFIMVTVMFCALDGGKHGGGSIFVLFGPPARRRPQT